MTAITIQEITVSDVYDYNTQTNSEGASGQDHLNFRAKYKTELCKNWELTGACVFEDACSFAHGAHELNSKPHVPKNYKTKLCKRFHEELYCPYGPRCQFRHSEADQKKAAAQQTKAPVAPVQQQVSTAFSKPLAPIPVVAPAAPQSQLSEATNLLEQAFNSDHPLLASANSNTRRRLKIFQNITLTKSSNGGGAQKKKHVMQCSSGATNTVVSGLAKGKKEGSSKNVMVQQQ
ncbi:hypothetical protein FGO68_gene4207 [Halteria grandinella]|uniref:C3H1-type domain-containing protein n=1 Tax=Halteria grandinella TaxID=5974 RepID=A0A8J8T3L3_HALGN|nr:hypothetical protein FGO68_gene4207 [Halteria grandinella]